MTSGWKPSYMGGGGYITGLLQHPQDERVWYARCDVAGVFRSLNRGESWMAMNKGMTHCHHHSVQSFAISPHNPELMLRGSGEERGGQMIGSLHKSSDGGETWYEVNGDMDFYGNGPTRIHGEVIAFDPFNNALAAAASFTRGIWLSHDKGETWRQAGLEGVRFHCLSYHPYQAGLLFAGTPDGVYVSKDGGQNWLHKAEGLPFSEFAFHSKDTSILYAACLDKGIYQSKDYGESWQPIMNGLPQNIGYLTLDCHPLNPDTLYTVPDLRGEHTWLDPIAIYLSKDGGQQWMLASVHNDASIIDYPEYMHARMAGWAICKIRCDRSKEGTLYISNWYGVAVSENEGATFNAHHFSGFETTCMENITSSPDGDRLYIVLADHAPQISVDGGRTYDHIPVDVEGYNSSTAIIESTHNPDVILIGMRTQHGLPKAAVFRTRSGAKNRPEIVWEKSELFVQALAEDPYREGRFYLYADGSITHGAGIYRSDDWGSTWMYLSSVVDSDKKTLPVQKHWIESELLSVVSYQVKNVCGTNQLLTCDPFCPEVIYFGEWTEGIYRSSDAGLTWERISQALPFGLHRASVLNVLRADPFRPGVLYAGFIREGLWVSEDRGKQWHKLFPKDHEVFNANSIAFGNQAGTVFVASEPLYWSQSPSAIYVTRNAGREWKPIYNGSKGALRWKGIAFHPETSTLHGVTCGNGAFYTAID